MQVTLFSEDFERITRQLDAAYDQIPFALMLSLNDALFETRQVLIDSTWPRSVTVRNATFLDWALHIEKATKDHLAGAIVDQSDGHVHLKMHADGGTKTPEGGPNFAIPSRNVDLRTQGGVVPSEKARNLKHSVKIGNRIYQFQGRGKNRHLVLMYTLKPSVRINADVPFRQDFDDAIRESAERHFVPRMQQAMRTR